jgi:hypothetical protein
MTSNQPAGWFPDPTGEPVQRYWDGGQWTRETRPFPPPGEPDAGVQPRDIPRTNSVSEGGNGSTAGSRSSGGSAVWVVLAVLVGVVLLGGGYALNRMQIDERAREAARQGANTGGTSNSLTEMTNLLCPQGSNTPPQPGVDCSRADLFK